MKTFEIYFIDERGSRVTVKVQACDQKEARRNARTQTHRLNMRMIGGPTEAFETA